MTEEKRKRLQRTRTINFSSSVGILAPSQPVPPQNYPPPFGTRRNALPRLAGTELLTGMVDVAFGNPPTCLIYPRDANGRLQKPIGEEANSQWHAVYLSAQEMPGAWRKLKGWLPPCLKTAWIFLAGKPPGVVFRSQRITKKNC